MVVTPGRVRQLGPAGGKTGGLPQGAAATGFGNVNGAAVIGGGEIAVFQAVGDDLREGGDFVGKDQIGAVGEEEVAVGVNAAGKTEIRTGEVAAVVAAEHAKLKHGNQSNFHLPSHVDVSTLGTQGADVQRHGNDFTVEAR